MGREVRKHAMGVAGPAVVFPADTQVQSETTCDLNVVLCERRVLADAPVVRIPRAVRYQAIGKVDEVVGWNGGACDTVGLIRRKAAVAQQDVGHISCHDPAPFPVGLRPIPLDALRIDARSKRMLAMVPGNLVAGQKALLDAAGRGEEIPSFRPRAPLRPCGNSQAADDWDQGVLAIARGST